MRQFTVRAATHREALEQMRALYGESAAIYSHRSVRIGGLFGLFGKEGVEITGSVADTMAGRGADAGHGGGRVDGAERDRRWERERLQQEKEKLMEQTSGRAYEKLMREIGSLREQLSAAAGAGLAGASGGSDHPTLRHIAEVLHANDFSPAYCDRVLADIRATHPLEALDDGAAVEHAVVRGIGAALRVVGGSALQAAPPPTDAGGADVWVLVGPTGVGKTTTVAKLAALYGVTAPADARRQVRIVTIDNYRIAAREQIAKYGEIMRVPVATAATVEELRKQLALAQDGDLVLVDTIGKSPNDFKRLAEMQTVLAAEGGRRRAVHLTVSATTKRSDLETVFGQFEPFGCQAVVITKLDETASAGGVLSCLIERRKPVSFLCDGQTVPQDIEPATVLRLLLKLDGFRLNRADLEREFGVDAASRTTSTVSAAAATPVDREAVAEKAR